MRQQRCFGWINYVFKDIRMSVSGFTGILDEHGSSRICSPSSNKVFLPYKPWSFPAGFLGCRARWVFFETVFPLSRISIRQLTLSLLTTVFLLGSAEKRFSDHQNLVGTKLKAPEERLIMANFARKVWYLPVTATGYQWNTNFERYSLPLLRLSRRKFWRGISTCIYSFA